MEDKTRTASWGRRNRNWLIPLAVVVMITGALLSLLSGTSDFAQAYTDEPLFKDAVAVAQENTRVTEVFGTFEPVGKLSIAEGNVKYTEDGKGITATITVKGSRQKGKLDFSATKDGGIWSFTQIKLRLKETGETITVLK